MAILRVNGLWPDGSARGAAHQDATAEAADVTMEEETAITRRLESDEAYKAQFEDMCAAGDAGTDVKRLFTAVSERNAKRARATPYVAEGAPPAQPHS